MKQKIFKTYPFVLSIYRFAMFFVHEKHICILKEFFGTYEKYYSTCKSHNRIFAYCPLYCWYVYKRLARERLVGKY